jgi:hypothetical protein
VSDFQKRDNWVGIDNRAHAKSVPKGFLRDAVNVDPLGGGVLGLRTGYTLRAAATSARGALTVKNQILYVDGTDLVAFDVDTDSTQVLAQVAGAGRLVGTVWNDELFFCTENETLRYDGNTLRRWGVPTVYQQPLPQVTSGGLAAGMYLFACTFTDDRGDQGATVNPVLMSIPDAGGVVVDLPAPPPGGTTRLWAGPRDSGTLYLQAQGVGPVLLSTITDSSERLELVNHSAPLVADHLEELNGVILAASGQTLWFTLPFRPHLLTLAASFFQYPATVDVVISVDGASGPGGVYVCADKTYWVTDVETAQPQQKTVLPYGAVPGTETRLPDNRVCWMTRYGLAVGDESGKIQLISANNFVPDPAERGASGMLEHNGNQLVVTTMRSTGDNPLAASDFYDLEIVPT